MDRLVGACEAAAAIRCGRLSSEELVSYCLERIERLEKDIGAWAFLDPAYALEQARTADRALKVGGVLGPLHGVPVGIKDIIDTRDMPTEHGTVLHAGRRPPSDATLVALLRQAGAVIIGKTVTTELAVFFPAATRNPHNPAHTPGGSSSGSAAAVAAGMIPLSVGTQTNGSMIRPAAFCGVYGYKPTFGLISRHRVLRQSRLLDQVGVFGRSVEDLALIGETLIGHDSGDPDTRLQVRLELMRTQAQSSPREPRLAFVKTPVWDQAEPSTRVAFEKLAHDLGDTAVETMLPALFERAHEQHRLIMEADLARNFAEEYHSGADQLSDILKEMIERGKRVTAVDYNNAVSARRTLSGALEEIFRDYDAIITPATLGEAPRGLESTGSPVFCTIWTLCGVPAISLPLLEGPGGLPLGVQLVGRRGDDAGLLRSARWLADRIGKK